MFTSTSISGYSVGFLAGKTLNECKEKCFSATKFNCKSIDVRDKDGKCWLKDKNRRDVPLAV